MIVSAKVDIVWFLIGQKKYRKAESEGEKRSVSMDEEEMCSAVLSCKSCVSKC